MKRSAGLNIAVIMGSTRRERFSEKPARWIFEEVGRSEGVTAELLDLRDYPLPFFDEPQGAAAMKGKYPNKEVRNWAEKIAWADAFIIVTPEYNHGYPAVLKNALDNLYVEWNNKPVGFVSWGGVAGARSVEQLRLVSIELQMVPIRNAVHIPAHWTLTDEAGNLKTDTLKDSAGRFLGQLLWWARVLKGARAGLQDGG